VNTDTAHIGDIVVFTITITNNGDIVATNVDIEDVLPSGYEYISHSTMDGTYNENSGIWTIPSIAGGSSVSLDISAEVLNHTDYLNTATLIDLDQIDTDDSNDSDSADLGAVLPARGCVVTVYNEFSPNEDGANDVFFIECIENYPSNKLEIYNRWGNIVYTKHGYLNDWKGYSNGRTVVNDSRKLPTGTYYYVLRLESDSKPLIGWIYLNR
jgi:gliding motility-associated-like protein/uncharacterized repeat protein (TIGR01451 family)